MAEQQPKRPPGNPNWVKGQPAPTAKPWVAGQPSPNPSGKPAGTISLSTRIQQMMDDEEFTTEMVGKDGKKVTFKGAPAMAIIKTGILKSMSGDKQWADWLARNGYGDKLDITSAGEKISRGMSEEELDAILNRDNRPEPSSQTSTST